MPVHPLKFFLSRVFACALILLTPHLVFGQAAGPQRVPIPPPLAKNASKPKTDRSSLPQIPIFKDVAKQLGLTVSHIAAPEAHYIIDSTSGGSRLFDCDDDGRLDIVLIHGSTVERLRDGGDPIVNLQPQGPDSPLQDIPAPTRRNPKSLGVDVPRRDSHNA